MLDSVMPPIIELLQSRADPTYRPVATRLRVAIDDRRNDISDHAASDGGEQTMPIRINAAGSNIDVTPNSIQINDRP